MIFTLDNSRNTTTGKHTNPTDHKHGSPLISPAIVDPPGLIPKQTFLSLNQNKEHVIQPVKEQDQKSGNQSRIGSAYQPETESASHSRVSSANRSVNQGGRYTLNRFFVFVPIFIFPVAFSTVVPLHALFISELSGWMYVVHTDIYTYTLAL